MRNLFSRTELPPIEELISALISANEFLYPEWSKEETIFNSLHAIRTLNSQKKIATYVNKVCKSAYEKIQEVTALELQLQLHTDINN